MLVMVRAYVVYISAWRPAKLICKTNNQFLFAITITCQIRHPFNGVQKQIKQCVLMNGYKVPVLKIALGVWSIMFILTVTIQCCIEMQRKSGLDKQS